MLLCTHLGEVCYPLEQVCEKLDAAVRCGVLWCKVLFISLPLCIYLPVKNQLKKGSSLSNLFES